MFVLLLLLLLLLLVVVLVVVAAAAAAVSRSSSISSSRMCIVKFESNFLLFFDYFSRTIDDTNRKYFCYVFVTFSKIEKS